MQKKLRQSSPILLTGFILLLAGSIFSNDTLKFIGGAIFFGTLLGVSL